MWLRVGYWTYTPKFRRTFAVPRSWPFGHHRDARLLRTRLQRTHSRAAHTRLRVRVRYFKAAGHGGSEQRDLEPPVDLAAIRGCPVGHSHSHG